MSLAAFIVVMGNSLFTLTSLNLNGIRSATSKGVEAWLEKAKPDCICVQEIKAQAPDMAGRFESLAGLKGHFQLAEKKGYSGVGVYARYEPSDVVIGYGSSEFDAEGRYVELRFDRPGRSTASKLSIISCYFPSGSSGEERQAAKFRFLAELRPHLLALKNAGREVVLCGDINIAHQEIDLKNFKGNKITLVFDEYITLENPYEKLTYSPIPKSNPNAEGKLKTITIKLKDTLEENTTYRIDFGEAIKDINENNILKERTKRYDGIADQTSSRVRAPSQGSSLMKSTT
jgi:exodeoxyribonuclease III